MTFPHNCGSISPLTRRIFALSSDFFGGVWWHRHEISQTSKVGSRALSNRRTSVANSDRHCVRWHGQEIFIATTRLFREQCDRLRRPAGTTCLPYPYSPIEATKTPLSRCDNVRHSLLLHFQPHFRKSTTQLLRQPKLRTKEWLVVHAIAFRVSLEDSPRPKSDRYVCSRTPQVESAPHR
jgi:hypothetical protein